MAKLKNIHSERKLSSKDIANALLFVNVIQHPLDFRRSEMNKPDLCRQREDRFLVAEEILHEIDK
jgi:hypothetical protein